MTDEEKVARHCIVLTKKVSGFMDRFVKDVYQGDRYSPGDALYITQGLVRHLTQMVLTSGIYLQNSSAIELLQETIADLLLAHGMRVIACEKPIECPESIN